MRRVRMWWAARQRAQRFQKLGIHPVPFRMGTRVALVHPMTGEVLIHLVLTHVTRDMNGSSALLEDYYRYVQERTYRP